MILQCKACSGFNLRDIYFAEKLLFGPNYLPFQWIPVALSRGVRLLLRLEMIGGTPALTHTTYDMHINEYVSILPLMGYISLSQ